jgi:Uma2 family endonuclease
VAIGEALLDRPGLRLTYERGSLEIRTLSSEHESQKGLLSRLVEVLVEELNMPARNLGSTTYQGEELQRGVEPDECYYLANYARVRGVRRIDLKRDPPPDLVLEVDVTHSSLDRMSIYAAFKVPEVWRLRGDALHVYRLGGAGHYQEAERSPTFPLVTPAELVRFVQLGEAEDDTSMVRAFRAWVREQLAHRPPAP